jgi:single-stranded-DNA-specific exonuclease
MKVKAGWAASIRTTEARILEVSRKRWVVKPTAVEAEDLAAELKVSRIAAGLLIARGCGDPDLARRFLRPSLADLHSPLALRDMNLAVDRLLRAIRGGEKIEIHGDYDVDGTTSTVILKTAIEMAGGLCTFVIPHRLRDGYGLQLAAVERAARAGITLIVSVDTGIRASAIVERARELGIDVVVTDHHLPEGELPRAVAVINPNRDDCSYPNKGLCGVGVAFKLVEALLSRLDWDAAKLRRVLDSFLKLAAIGTVADVVPLTGENRAIVSLGLAGLRVVKNPGLRALLDAAGVAPGEQPTARQVGFQIAPRINAAGRIASADQVVELFFTRDQGRARQITEELQRLNSTRQAEEAGIVEEILQLCENEPVDESQFALVFSGVGWHRGVLGIVASRLVERFGRPAFVLGEDGGESAGSGRSIAGFHLLEALEGMRELFLKFGGHSHAAGLTLPADQVAIFRERLNRRAAACLTAEDLTPALEIDARAELSDLDDRLFAEMQALEPFGSGNRAPLFAAFGLEIESEPRVMKEKHVRVSLRQGRRTLSFTGFRFANRIGEFERGARIDAVFSMEEDSYNGGWAPTLRDVRRSL